MTKKHITTGSEKVYEAFDLLKQASMDKRAEFQDAVAEIVDKARDVRSMATDRVMDAASSVNKSAHHTPWAYIAGAGVVGLVSGILMQRRH